MAEAEQLRERVGPIADVLHRHGFDPRPYRLFCPNPTHNDRHPGSVRILPATGRGPERIYCHSCLLNEDNIGLARLLGESIEFSSSRPRFTRRRRDERTRRIRTQRWLEDNPEAVEAFRVARRLAELSYDDALSELFQIRGSTDAAFGGMVLSFSDRIRKQALESYADPELRNDPEVVKSSVRKLLATL